MAYDAGSAQWPSAMCGHAISRANSRDDNTTATVASGTPT
jgi:hypothetical protein